MFEIFTAFGIWVATFVGIVVLGLIIAWIDNNDHDCCLRWLVTCAFYAATVTYFVFIRR
jgi:hypothetical protein